MHGIVLVFLGLALAADPLELPKDVSEIDTRQFAIPLHIDPDQLDKIEKIRLFVSEDQGKTWKHKKDCKPSDELVLFKAPRDGLYWFAVQAVSKDGHGNPADLDNLIPARKIYVNSQRRALKTQKSYEELQGEIEQLRRTVEQLQERVKQLESDRKPK